MSKVNVTFAGLVLCGPARPSGEMTADGPFCAVFPASTRRRTANPLGTFIPFHMPVLMCDTAPRDGGFRSKDDSVANQKGVTTYLWYPSGERLEFVIDGSDTPGTLNYDTSVDSISDMREVWPAHRKIPADALQLPPPRSVLGQVFIPFGTMKANGDAKSVRFDPPRSRPSVAKDIRPEITVTFDADEIIEIYTSSLETGNDLGTIRFDVTTNHDITIVIANGDPEDLRERALHLAESTRKGPSGGGDFDFELYYTILAPTETRDLPVPVSAAPGPSASPSSAPMSAASHAQQALLIRDCYVAIAER